MNEGGWGHKMGINLCIYHPINLHGVEIRFLNIEQPNPIGIMANTNLINQRQVFVEGYVRSEDHLEEAKTSSINLKSTIDSMPWRAIVANR